MIYRITENLEHYMRFYIDNIELYAKMGEDITINLGSSMEKYSEHWIKPDGYFYRNEQDYPDANQVPDITIWMTRLILNEKAYDVLADTLGADCEFLPVNCEGITYHIANILRFAEELDALDEGKCEYYEIDGYQTDLKNINFKEDNLEGVLLFKSEYDGYNRIFCRNEFKKLVEASGLNGLIFKTDLAGFM